MILPSTVKMVQPLFLHVEIEIPMDIDLTMIPGVNDKNLTLSVCVKIPMMFKVRIFLVKMLLKLIYIVLGRKAEHIKITTDVGPC